MRIIAGEHRSRRILSPEGTETTRPITDRAKQSLFDRLAAHGMFDGGNVLDLFCGTGSLGLEALSRGAEHCTFIERDRDALQLLERNISDLRLTDRATILRVDALTGGWVATLQKLPLTVLFCDPPYALTDDEVTRSQVLKLIQSFATKTEPLGMAVLRMEKRVEECVIDGWLGPLRAEFGSMAIHCYQMKGDEEAEGQSDEGAEREGKPDEQ